MKHEWDVIIIGAGIAGISAAERIAEAGNRQSVLIVSDEDRAPYKRTKISKYIASGFEPEQFSMRSPEWFRESNIELLSDAAVRRIDPARRMIETTAGRRFTWGTLIIATGVRPRRLELEGISAQDYHVIRTAADTERLMREVDSAGSVGVVGLGVLGVEVCDQLAKMGKRVVGIGTHSSIMPRELNRTAAERMHVLFRDAGIETRLNERVCGVRSAGDRYRIRLQRSAVEVDQFVFCGGCEADLSLAREAGLRVRDGIIVDEHMRTSATGIFAAGDVAEHPGGATTHLWHAAELQGRIAGANAVGIPEVHEQPLFRLKCEVFGHYFFSVGKVCLEDDAVTPVEAVEEDPPQYRCFYYQEGRLCGVVMMDDRDRAKLYERAAREHWTRERVEREFSVSTGAAS